MQPNGTAAFLSALVPGLGQFYNREWLKGIAFLAAMVVLDAAFNVTSDTIRLFQAMWPGAQTADATAAPTFGSLLVRSLPVFVVVCWSAADAARVARRRVDSSR